jgi:hypothetical protein
MSTDPAPVQRLVGRISKADANRRHHLKGCAGYEDCQCFGRYWTHAEIYSMKEIMREACCLLRECLPHSTGGPPGYLNNRISVWLERADPPNPPGSPGEAPVHPAVGRMQDQPDTTKQEKQS